MTVRYTLAMVALAVLGLFVATAGPTAQFETPNRAFHNATSFRLDGRHQSVPCASCHVNGQYAGTPTTCYQCHWIRRKDDRYQTRLGSECESCHRPTSWTAVNFNHTATSGVALGTNHRTLSCDSCHKDAQFAGATADCISCHRRDFEATKSPDHLAAGFPVTCDSCHRPNDGVWQNAGGSGFAHAAAFPLVGRHASATCQSCHRNSVYKGTARDCAGCHMADYNRTQNPGHAPAGFPTTCETCHRASDADWQSGSGGSFNHTAIFTLVGTHATQACAACHRNNVYRGTARDCVGCHQVQYNATSRPNHAAAGFPATCDSCHRATDAQWTGISFNHTPFFALQGVHATQACAACHVNNVYKGTARDCVGCHLSRYNSSTDPNHIAAGFPTACDSCHRATDAAWTQGRFTHTQFPLTSRHNVPCAECHTTANNFRVFSCTVCHARSEMDSKHRGRAGYIYDSNACYSCHPNGKAG